jgi:mxaL protein
MSAAPSAWSWAVWRSERRGWALAGAALALAASFARPLIHLERPRFEQVVVLDVTQSMNVADETMDGRSVSRLAAAKQALRQAVEALPCGSKIGWAIFTEYRAYLLFMPVEVCAHRAELRSSLAAIDSRMAWSGNSEVAKGLHSGLGIAKQLPGVPSLVFVTDGHEAPPLSPHHRPRFDDKPGEVAGVVVGVGALRPSPIPKSDALGRPLGWWGADEVQQTDPRSQGRSGSVSGERLADEAEAAPAAALGAMPGSEHLSSLREAYLRLLAAENGLAYHRLRSAEELAAALRAPALVRPVQAPLDLRPALAALALGLLLLAWWPATWRRR